MVCMRQQVDHLADNLPDLPPVALPGPGLSRKDEWRWNMGENMLWESHRHPEKNQRTGLLPAHAAVSTDVGHVSLSSRAAPSFHLPSSALTPLTHPCMELQVPSARARF